MKLSGGETEKSSQALVSVIRHNLQTVTGQQYLIKGHLLYISVQQAQLPWPSMALIVLYTQRTLTACNFTAFKTIYAVPITITHKKQLELSHSNFHCLIYIQKEAVSGFLIIHLHLLHKLSPMA